MKKSNVSVDAEAIPDEVVDEVDEIANNQTQFKIIAQTCEEEVKESKEVAECSESSAVNCD